MVNNAKTNININNSGTIIGGNNSSGGHHGIEIWGNNSATSTIENLTNSGLIEGKANNGSSSGVSLANPNNVVKTFTNTGTIIGKNNGIWNRGTIETLTNNGFIQGGNTGIRVERGATIGNLTNTGTIIGDRGAFHVFGKIETLTNSGTIINNSENRVVAGIKLEGGGRIEHIKNSGTIMSNTQGIVVSHGSFGTLTMESGSKIHAKATGIEVGQWQTLGKLEVKDGASIYGDVAGILLSSYSQTSGIMIENGGKIDSANYGMHLSQAHLNGNTVITGNGSAIQGNIAGIYLSNGAELKGTIEVKDNGIIAGGVSSDGRANGYGIVNADNSIIGGYIVVDSGGKITGILNQDNGHIKGSIEVKGENSAIVGGITNTGNATIDGNINISNGGKLDSITNTGNGKLEGSIKIEGEGSKLDSIINTGNGTIGGSVSVGQGSSVESVINSGSGTISGSITNNGNLGSINNSGNISGNIENNSGNIEINNDGKLDGAINVGSGAGDTIISNGSGGVIGGGIANNGDGSININNQGTVNPDKDGNHITNNGSGSVNVDDWLVKPNPDGSIDGAINVGGNGSGSTNIGDITIDTSDGNFNANKPINPDTIINNTGNGNVSRPNNIGTNDGGLIDLAYDPITGTYRPLIDVSMGMGSVMAQTVVNTYVMRSFFIDTVLDDASRMAFKHARKDLSNKDLSSFNFDEHYHGFILPYFSSNSIKLLGNDHYSKGNTKGIVAGFHTLKDIGMLGAYIGTEEAHMKTLDYFSLKMQTMYAGLKYSNFIIKDDLKEAFVKAHTKVAFSQNDLDKFIGTRHANADTQTYGYGASVGAGMNFYLNGEKSIITPEVSLNYEGGFTKAFSMNGEAAVNHERYYKNELNLFSSTASLKWYQNWFPQISTSFETGAKINFNPQVQSRANIAHKIVSEELDLARSYYYAQSSLIFSLAKDLEMSFNYNGTFSSNSHSHTGYLQFDFIF